MPKTKHRRKAGGKAVPHPGRGKEGSPFRLRVEERQEGKQVTRAMQDSVRGLPLFDASKPTEPS
jgi:hypothetical protein